MRDIVERLEIHAFVADKTQSGMAPLFEECLEEITRLRAENETLRRDVKTAIMGDSAELQDVKRENEKLREALKPFASIETLFCDSDEMEFELWFLVKADGTNDNPKIKIGDLRAAAAAIKDTDNGSV